MKSHNDVEIPLDKITAIAGVCHEQNRAYAMMLGDFTQEPWATAPDWARESAIKGVIAIVRGEVKCPGQSHASWLAEKERTGWTWGPIKDERLKQHPCMVPYEELPEEQQAKDTLFVNTAMALLSYIDPDIGTEKATALLGTPAFDEYRTYPVSEAVTEDLARRFTYHPPQPDQKPRYEFIRARLEATAFMVCNLTPPSREQSLALTKLEEAGFWANASIARGES